MTNQKNKDRYMQLQNNPRENNSGPQTKQQFFMGGSNLNQSALSNTQAVQLNSIDMQNQLSVMHQSPTLSP